MSKVCFRCGSPVDDSDRFCRACGAAVTDADADEENDAPDVFVLKPGTARLEIEEENVPDAESEPEPEPEPEAPAESAPEPPRPPLTRREKRIAKKLSRCDREEDEEDYEYPPEVPKKKGHLKAKLLSLLVAILFIAGLVGVLYLRQSVEQAAFAPIETAYEGFSDRSPAALENAFYPELYSAMTDLGYLSAGGYWTEQIDNWQSVYGRGFTAAPTLRRSALIRGTEKEDYLNLLETEYAISPRPRVLMKLDYTVSVTADNVDASVRKSAYVGYIGGKWYLLQEEF